MDIKLILGYSSSTVELSHGDTRAGETRKSRGWVVSFQDAVGGQRMPVTRPSLRARLQNWRQRNKEPVWVLVQGGKLPLSRQELYNRDETNWRRGKGFRFWRHFMKLHIQYLTYSDLLFEAKSLMSCFSTQCCFLCQLRDDDIAFPKTKRYYCLWEFLPSCT